MKLRIDNFALIKHAEIDIDGITVIAGNNNSGKSTVGKILFSIFTALSNIDEKIEAQRVRMIQRVVASKIYRVAGEDFEYHLWGLESEIRDFVSIHNGSVVIDWKSFINKYEDIVPDLAQKGLLEEMQQAVAQIETWPRLRLIMNAISPYFSSCFHQQINSLSAPNVPAKVSLYIKSKEISMVFKDNLVAEINPEMELTNKVIFYSSPTVVDLMDARIIDNLPMKNLIRLLSSYSDRMTDDSDLLEKSMLQGRLGTVLKKIDAVLPGRIQKQRRGYGLYRPEWKEPLSVKNLSMGLKAFVVLKMLLESNQLKDKDVLILDEPEIHLHPTWQLLYAELIVLLQKEFDLSVIVTTHSNFFLDAIETYTNKYQTQGKLHLYLSELENGGIEMHEVTRFSEEIYGKMADALDELDSERLFLNNLRDE